MHKTNDRVEHDMELTVKHKVPIVITSLGARKEVYDAVHSYGGIVFHDIINNFFATFSTNLTHGLLKFSHNI